MTTFSRAFRLPAALAAVTLFASLGAKEAPSPYSTKIHQDVEKIRQEVDQEGLTFQVGPNAAMQYSLSQLCGRKPGIPVPREFQEHEPGGANNYMPQPMATAALPATFYGWASSVKNQGSCGDCWAFGTIGALEGTYLKTHGSAAIKVSTSGAITVSGSSPNLSEQQVTSCNPWGWNCNGGNVAFDMLVPTKTGTGHYPGAVTETCFPFVASNAACHLCSNPTYTPVVTWGYLTSDSTIPTVTAIKTATQTYGCVTAYVYATSAFQAYTGGVFSSTKKYTSTNHEIVLCGWDDSKQAWLLKNSWGPTWGINGFMWITYTSCRVGEGAAWCTTN